MSDQHQTHSEKSDPPNDVGRALKINDAADDTASDEDPEVREGHPGEALTINENTAGDDS